MPDSTYSNLPKRIIFVGYEAGNPDSLKETRAALVQQNDKFGMNEVILLPNTAKVSMFDGVCEVHIRKDDMPFCFLTPFVGFNEPVFVIDGERKVVNRDTGVMEDADN